jgi:hypothetical protein
VFGSFAAVFSTSFMPLLLKLDLPKDIEAALAFYRVGSDGFLIHEDPAHVISLCVSIALFPTLPQWLVLRRHIGGAHWWIWATAVGSILAFWIFRTLNPDIHPWYLWPWQFFLYPEDVAEPLLRAILGGATHGALVGMLQWLWLLVKGWRPRWWIPVSTLSWALATGIYTIDHRWLLLVPILPGAIMGVLLVRLLRQRLPAAPSA